MHPLVQQTAGEIHMNENGKKIDRKQLSYPMLINCVDTIRANLASFSERGLTDEMLAEELTKKCGFSVTVVNARTARHAANVKWSVKYPNRGATGQRKRVASPNMITVAKSLLEMATALGYSLAQKEELQRIAEGQPKDW